VWRGGGQGEAAVLARCWTGSLDLAHARGGRTVAFPAISAGAYGYPMDAAARDSLRAAANWLRQHPGKLDLVRVVLAKERDAELWSELLGQVVRQGRHPPSANAIWLGEGDWIEVADLTGRRDAAVDIDPELRSLEAMWQALESSCVAECCGLDAFDFSAGNIASAAGRLDVPEVCAALAAVRRHLGDRGADVLLSHRLNYAFERGALDALLGHLLTHLSTTPGARP